MTNTMPSEIVRANIDKAHEVLKDVDICVLCPPNNANPAVGVSGVCKSCYMAHYGQTKEYLDYVS